MADILLKYSFAFFTFCSAVCFFLDDLTCSICNRTFSILLARISTLDKNLLAIVNHHSIGKFKVLGTSKLIEYIAGLVKNDHSHHFAFNHNDATFIINGDSARMLQDIGTKFAHKLTILVINLDLKK